MLPGQLLYTELGWHSLAQRRLIHRLRLYYKAMNDLTPSYFMDLLPPIVRNRHDYPLRNRNDMTVYRARSQTFFKSYFPRTTRDWNELPIHIRQSTSVLDFNKQLDGHIARPPRKPWYDCGDRMLSIHHARLRLGCSGLKGHLHFNLHVEDDPDCMLCGMEIENSAHYFLRCRYHQEYRNVLFEAISLLTEPSLQVILYGDSNLTLQNNIDIALSVQNFIKTSNRFMR